MSENTPSPVPASEQPKKHRRKWPWVLLALVLILVLLVILAPTLVSSGPGRNFVLGQINSRLNGTVQIDDLSVGWMSATEVRGVRVFDRENRPVFELKRLYTPLSLWSALRGGWKNLDVTVDEPNLTQLVIDENGRSNYEALIKSEPGTASKPASGGAAESRLPDVRVKLAVNDLRGTIVAPHVPPVHIEPSTIKLDLPDINSAATADVKLSYRVADGPVGGVNLAGTVAAIRNNQVDLANLSADLALQVSRLALEGVSPFLKMAGLDLQIAGVADGSLKINTQGLDLAARRIGQGRIEGELRAEGFEAAGGLLAGDRFKADRIVMPVKISPQTREGQSWIVVERLDVLVEPNLVKLVVTANVPESAPDRGEAAVQIDANLAALAARLPNTIKLMPGAKIESGRLTSVSGYAQGGLKTETKISDVAGSVNGRPVRLSPVEFSAEANVLSGQAPRNLKLDFVSGFAKAGGGGPTLGELQMAANFDLSRLQKELEQFVRLDELLAGGKKPARPLELAGTGDLKLQTKGDVTADNAPFDATLNLVMSGVRVAGVGDLPPIQQSRLALDASGRITRGPATRIDNAKVNVIAGEAQAPALELAAGGGATLGKEVSADFVIERMMARDLARLQSEYGSLVPALKENRLTLGGSMEAKAAGRFDGKSVSLREPMTVSVRNLDVRQDGEKPLALRAGEIAAAMNFKQSPQAIELDVPNVRISRLAVDRAGAAWAAPSDVTLQLAAALEQDAAGNLRQVRVSRLDGDLAVAKLSMPEAITLTNLDAAKPTAQGAIQLTGRIEDVAGAAAALGGQAGGYPYRGQFEIRQRITTGGEAISLAGDGTVSDFRVMQGDTPAFTEPKVAFSNRLSVDPAKAIARVETLSLDMAGSGAVKLAAQGQLVDWNKARRFENTQVTLDYDAAQVWKIVRPMLPPEQQKNLEDAQVVGKSRSVWTIQGGLPADVPFNEAVKRLQAQGGLSLETLSAMGFSLTKIDLPIVLREGKATVGAGKGPIQCNGGILDISTAVVDLGADVPRLSIPADHVLMKDVALNPALVHSVNGIVPLFDDDARNAARMDVTVVRCDRLPLGDLILRKGQRNDGAAEVEVSFNQVQLGGPIIGLIASVSGDDFRNSLRGDVRDAKVSIAKGETRIDDFALLVGERQRAFLRLSGALDLRPEGALNLTMNIPPALLRQVGISRKDLAKWLPEGVDLPIGGTRGSPQLLQFDKIIGNLIGQAAQKALLGNLTGEKKEPAAANDSHQPAASQPAQKDPLGGLIDLLTKDRDKDKSKEREERRKK